MRQIITTILMLASLVIGCNPVTPDAPKELSITPPQVTPLDCRWTEAVKYAGDGTGTMVYTPFVFPPTSSFCVCLPIQCDVLIIGVNPLSYRMLINGQEVSTWVCDTRTVIGFQITFPDAPETYAVGDAWYFNLTY